MLLHLACCSAHICLDATALLLARLQTLGVYICMASRKNTCIFDTPLASDPSDGMSTSTEDTGCCTVNDVCMPTKVVCV